MDQMNRKSFLTAGIAAAAATLASACGMGGDKDVAMAIHIQGTLANPAPMFDGRVNLSVSGSAAALSGQGYSFLAGDPQVQTASASMWSLHGAMEKDALKLQGTTLLANNQMLLGAPVTVEVDMKTGECTWTMGPFLDGSPAFTSRGRVTVTRTSAQMNGAVGTSTPRPPGRGGI
jgi:hypothetical protein